MNINYITASLNFIIAMVWLRTKIKGNKIVASVYLLATVVYIVLGAMGE